MAKDGLDFEGLDEFQKDLLALAQEKLPRESFKIMRKIGNRATTHVRRVARSKVTSKTGNYYKGFKRGKVFKDADGKIVTRVINSSPHAHLIEDGHRIVTHDGREVGFVPGKNVLADGIRQFDAKRDAEKMLEKWLDEMLDSEGL